MNKTSRKYALREGLPRYHTGKACKNGHVADRYTLSGVCVECVVDQKARERAMYEKSKNKNQEALNNG